MGQSAFNKNLVSSWYLFLPFAFFSCLTFKSRIRLNKTAVRLNSICGTIDSSSRGAKKRDAFWYAMISDLKGCVLFPNRCSAKEEILTSTMIIHMRDLLSTGLRTPNEGINQRYLKNWADVADKVPRYLGVGVNFWPRSEGYFLYGRLRYYMQSPNT